MGIVAALRLILAVALHAGEARSRPIVRIPAGPARNAPLNPQMAPLSVLPGTANPTLAAPVVNAPTASVAAPGKTVPSLSPSAIRAAAERSSVPPQERTRQALAQSLADLEQPKEADDEQAFARLAGWFDLAGDHNRVGGDHLGPEHKIAAYAAMEKFADNGREFNSGAFKGQVQQWLDSRKQVVEQAQRRLDAPSRLAEYNEANREALAAQAQQRRARREERAAYWEALARTGSARDYYEMFGIARDASEAELLRALHRRMEELAPDLDSALAGFANRMSDDVQSGIPRLSRRESQRLWDRYRQAYNALSTDRRRYDAVSAARDQRESLEKARNSRQDPPVRRAPKLDAAAARIIQGDIAGERDFWETIAKELRAELAALPSSTSAERRADVAEQLIARLRKRLPTRLLRYFHNGSSAETMGRIARYILEREDINRDAMVSPRRVTNYGKLSWDFGGSMQHSHEHSLAAEMAALIEAGQGSTRQKIAGLLEIFRGAYDKETSYSEGMPDGFIGQDVARRALALAYARIGEEPDILKSAISDLLLFSARWEAGGIGNSKTITNMTMGYGLQLMPAGQEELRNAPFKVERLN